MANFLSSKENEIERLKKTIIEMEKTIFDLKLDIKTLSGRIDNIVNQKEKTVPTISEQPVQISSSSSTSQKSESETIAHSFYLSTPNADGSFNNSSASSIYKEGASIFKFQNTLDNIAEFQINDHDASVKLALAYPDRIVAPVCEALNAHDPKARRIFTVEPGIAELTGDNKWKVVTKARIRYES